MKYSCGIIRDLLPLYHDGVCAGESAQAVEEHLADCEACREQYQALKEPEAAASDLDAVAEQKRVEALRRVRRAIRRKRILACALSMLAVLVLSGGTAGYLRGTEVTVAPESIERVDWADGDLTAWVQGDTYTQASSRLVTVEENGAPVNVLYFCLRSTLWNRAWASASNGGARYTLAYGIQGAPEIDRVCYYAGNFEDFQKLTTADWERGDVPAQLVWGK